MLLLDIVPFSMSGWEETLLDSIFFAAIASPPIYYWVIKSAMQQDYASTSSISTRSGIGLILLISFSAFLFDISLPLGVAAGVPYIALVLIGLWFPNRNSAIGLALIGSILTIIGYYVSDPMGIHWMVLSNRGLALFAIWLTAILVTNQKWDTAELILLHSVADNANSIHEPKIAMQKGLDDICSYTGWPLGHVYLSAPGALDQLVSSDIWYHQGRENYKPFIQASMSITDVEKGVGLPGRVLDGAESIWVDNLDMILGAHRSKAAVEAGIKSACAVPILAGERVVAVMEFFSERVTEPDKHIIHLLSNIGRQLGRVFERSRAAEQLSYMASHDYLTGLPNLSLGKDRLNGAISLARRNSRKSALMFIDLDGFKLINDTLGHKAGDQLLKEISARFLSCIRDVDTVARIGGDEFIIILPNIDDDSGAEKVALKLIDAVNKGFGIQDQKANVGLSIGVAMYPDHADNAALLLKKADEAMYIVKAKGKNNYVFAVD